FRPVLLSRLAGHTPPEDSTVAIDDRHIEGIAVREPEAHASAIVDSNAPLPGTITFRRLQAVGRGQSEVVHADGSIELSKTHRRTQRNRRRNPLRLSVDEKALGLRIGKRPDHVSTICL